MGTVLFLLLSIFLLFTIKDVPSATTQFHGKGLSAVPSILVFAIINTSLSEEILFRGFILKRLSNVFGF